MFIDTHCHLAWDVDDGIESKQQAMIALQDASQDGIKEIIATPHFIPGSNTKQDIEEINQRIEELHQLAKAYGITIYQGAELFLNHEYLDMIDAGMVNTLHQSQYLLVEFDVRKEMNENSDADDMLYELTIRDYVPVVAHVERYFHEDLDIARVKKWIKLGCKIQVNRTSVLGMHGKRCQEHAVTLLEHGLVHVVATDAHRETGSRRCILSDVAKKLEKLVGEENTVMLCHDNPKAMIEHRLLADMKIIKRSFLRRLLNKR